MIEAPEALYLSEQLNRTIKGKQVTDVIVKHTPHKFTFWNGDPEDTYLELLAGKTIDHACPQGGMVEISLENVRLVLTDGVNLRYYAPGEKIPAKHQFLLIFEDESCLIASVRMYGGIMCFREGDFKAPIAAYYETAKTKTQVMSDDFSKEYFMELINDESAQKKTAKAFLATEQTIPGLGNGVLQDILYTARIHPKTRINELPKAKREELYDCVKSTLEEIYRRKGRNTETDLFGVNGGYVPFLSKDTAGKECLRCDGLIIKENYLGGSIYYCNGCQPFAKNK